LHLSESTKRGKRVFAFEKPAKKRNEFKEEDAERTYMSRWKNERKKKGNSALRYHLIASGGGEKENACRRCSAETGD